MALSSVFYDGPVTETDRAKNRTGAPDYGVYGAGDFQVTTNGAVPFSTKIKAGRAHGWGVTDTAETDQTLIHDTVATGTRWDLVVVRRNWQPLLGGPSTLVAIKGGAFTDIPAGRKVDPGIEDDQPLALVGWKSGQTAPFQIIDLRCWASNGGIEVASEIALEYLGRPGTCVQLDGVTYRYTRQGNGAWGWSALPTPAFAQHFDQKDITIKGEGGQWNFDFPPGLFTKSPFVELSKHSAAGAGFIPYVASVTPTGVRVGVYWPGNKIDYRIRIGIHATQARADSSFTSLS